MSQSRLMLAFLAASLALSALAVVLSVGPYLSTPKKPQAPDPLLEELKLLHEEKIRRHDDLAVRIRDAHEDGRHDFADELRAEQKALAEEYKARNDALYRKHGKEPPRTVPHWLARPKAGD